MSRNCTALVVDDDDLVCAYLSQLLAEAGWRVTAVASGAAALAQLRATAFDAVVCDLDLGVPPSGLDVLSQIPALNKDTPFVMLTGHGSIDRCREAFLLGASDFLEKPLGCERLVEILKHAVADSRPVVVDHTPADIAGSIGDSVGAAHVRTAVATMERRFAEHGLSVADVASECGITPEHLARLFRAHVGHPPLEHIHHIRIDRAERLLADRRLSIYAIAFDCGYRRTSEFSGWFRRIRGITPSGFRLR